jgi:DNA polymerase III alpha subunit (gram-positive type)
MSFRFPYLSLDIETTGLDRQHVHVLQLAAIYDNGKDLEKLPTFNEVIRWPVITYGEEYAMHLNRELLEQAFRKENVVTLEEARRHFADFLMQVQPKGRITAAGKNVDGFDLPILKNPVNGFVLPRVNRRVLDPGSMFTEEFDHVPSLDELNRFLGRSAVSHDALDDCWDVVHAVRYKWGM